MWQLLIACVGLLFSWGAQAQTEKNLVKDGKANTDSFVFNQRDEHGKPTGLWYRLHPEERGNTSFWEFGYFLSGIRNGPWYKLSRDGEILSIENYRNSVLSGEAKYYEHGRLATIGHYRGYQPYAKFDTIVVIDPVTYEEAFVAVENDHGFTRHGTWQYFNPLTGALVKEEEWQVDELIFQKHYALNPADSTSIRTRELQMPHNRRKAKPSHSSGKGLIEGN